MRTRLKSLATNLAYGFMALLGLSTLQAGTHQALTSLAPSGTTPTSSVLIVPFYTRNIAEWEVFYFVRSFIRLWPPSSLLVMNAKQVVVYM